MRRRFVSASNLVRSAVASVQVHARAVEVPHIQAVIVLLKLPTVIRPLHTRVYSLRAMIVSDWMVLGVGSGLSMDMDVCVCTF